MDSITLPIITEDVATLRRVFTLALDQSEATLEDGKDWMTLAERDAAQLEHNTLMRFMARVDAMLPDSTGFFD